MTAPNGANFSVVASGNPPLSYQWRRDGADISGATSESYVLKPTAGGRQRRPFDVVVTNSAGRVTSAAGTLTVSPAAGHAEYHDAAGELDGDRADTATFSVVATGEAPLSYQWRRNGANISGATSASYILNPTASSDSGATFDVVVSNVAGSIHQHRGDPHSERVAGGGASRRRRPM